MKALLISVNPKQAAKILNGEQTVIIKKTMPKCDLPIDVYVYCTKNGRFVQEEMESVDDTGWCDYPTGIYATLSKEDEKRHGKPLNAKVFAKFVLREADEFSITPFGTETPDDEEALCSQSCMRLGELIKHLRHGLFGCAYYISDLQIFDEPKELSNFRYWGCLDKVKQAPKTFTYVEGLE